MKRSEASVRNAAVAVITNFITIIIGFIAQKIFSVTLGQEYLGLNGLFSNIISMLTIVELGVGSAIIYHLYEPISNKNYNKINALMNFYKKAYRVIASIIFVLGICIIPFLKAIVGEITIIQNIYYMYLLFLTDAIASYLLTYKRSILYANQENYIINLVHIAYLLIMNGLQSIFLFMTHNYAIYLIIKIICRILENLILTMIVNIKYKFLRAKAEELDQETKNDISKKVKALVLHKIGEFVVKGTDNIIISKFLGIVAVGLYSGYSMILNSLNLLMQQIYDAITASIGNLLVEKDKEKSFAVYKNLEFLNFWLSAFMAISFYCIVTPFVKMWLGENYLLETSTILTLAINFYFRATRKNINAFKTAKGIFYEDRFMPILESLVNLVASILLVKLIGFPGVFIGTILSNLILHFYGYPKYVYAPIFGRNKNEYIIRCIKNFLISFGIGIITTLCSFMVKGIYNIILNIVIKLIICCVVPNLIIIIVFYKTDEFKFVLSLSKTIIRKISGKILQK